MERELRNWMSKEAGLLLEDWLWRNEETWRAEGADPLEVREDVEIHLQMKSESLGRVLGSGDMESALGEMERPDTGMPAEVPDQAHRQSKRNLSFSCLGWMRVFKSRFFLGVWPLLVILVEGVFGLFGGIMFDPISRWPQLVLLLGVGILAVMGQRIRDGQVERPWLVFLLGAGFVPAVYWGVLSLVVMIMAVVLFVEGLMISFGVALVVVPIAVVCGIIAAAPIFAGAGFWKASEGRRRGMPWVYGLGAGLLLLILVEGPAYITRYGLAKDDPAIVRNWGSKELLGDMAREGTWGFSTKDTSGLMTDMGLVTEFVKGSRREKEDVMARRRFYYRVTGESAFDGNADSFLSSRRMVAGRFDAGQGGDEVGAKVKNLEMSDSRLDGHVDGSSGLGYWEWTMEFHNRDRRGKEARMQVLLPPGGVVSRLTLWVEGEPQEAAFGAKSQVTAAYKSIVKRQQDPVLVRWVGADRVMVQCFPVPSNGKMKIRVGVTAPLDDQGRLYLPKLMEKNFEWEKELETAVWVQGDVEMSMDGLEGVGAAGRWRETHGSLSLEKLTSHHAYVACHEAPEEEVVWTEDQFAEKDERILIRERLPDESGSRSLVLVVDGSGYFERWHDSLKSAVQVLMNRGISVQVIYAVEKGGFGDGQELEFVGGQDNLPALLEGIELASRKKADQLIWLHGAQPVEMEKPERLVQVLERSFHRVKISTMDLAGGPNRLLEQLELSVPISSAGRPASPEDLEKALIRAVEKSHRSYRYRTLPEGSRPEGVKVWGQLARWRVWEEVKRGFGEGGSRESLAIKAAKYQLVTPVSAAVVLEKQEQYERFGLDQVDEATVPSIPGVPEPSTGVLVMMASAMMWRRRRGACGPS